MVWCGRVVGVGGEIRRESSLLGKGLVKVGSLGG